VSIPENQLETWAKQGAVATSASTYASIKTVLESPHAPYSKKDFETFLQGSYANDTNVYSESDVDIVIKLNSTFYKDLSNLTEVEKSAYQKDMSPASYSYEQYKSDVAAWLARNYKGVEAGKKAIFVPADGARRDADVLPAAQYRRYYSYKNAYDNRYAEGICFFVDGVIVDNFPKQHKANCTAKHQRTGGRFKRIVRVFKNMRNRMVDLGYLDDGVAPSYFLEGMLYNVPDDLFGNSIQDSVVDAFNWVQDTEKSKLTCANELHWLIRDGKRTSWNAAGYAAYATSFKKFWDEW